MKVDRIEMAECSMNNYAFTYNEQKCSAVVLNDELLKCSFANEREKERCQLLLRKKVNIQPKVAI